MNTDELKSEIAQCEENLKLARAILQLTEEYGTGGNVVELIKAIEYDIRCCKAEISIDSRTHKGSLEDELDQIRKECSFEL